MELTQRAARWARKAHTGRGVTVALPNPLPLGVAQELLAAGLKLKRSELKDNWAAVLLDGPEESKAQLLAAVKPPKSRGSRTEGNLLPH